MGFYATAVNESTCAGWIPSPKKDFGISVKVREFQNSEITNSKIATPIEWPETHLRASGMSQGSICSNSQVKRMSRDRAMTRRRSEKQKV